MKKHLIATTLAVALIFTLSCEEKESDKSSSSVVSSSSAVERLSSAEVSALPNYDDSGFLTDEEAAGVGVGWDSSIKEIQAATEIIAEYFKEKKEKALKEGRTFTDSRDGKTYMWVKIGEQVWMAQNLNYKPKSGKSECLYDSYCDYNGRLYFWGTAMKACPAGFHLPSSDEWDILAQAIGSEHVGKKLKAASGWYNNGNGTDIYGFSALPGGWRDFEGKSAKGSAANLYLSGYLWTATEKGENHVYYREISYFDDYMLEGFTGKKFAAYSVRCVKDNNQMEASQ